MCEQLVVVMQSSRRLFEGFSAAVKGNLDRPSLFSTIAIFITAILGLERKATWYRSKSSRVQYKRLGTQSLSGGAMIELLFRQE